MVEIKKGKIGNKTKSLAYCSLLLHVPFPSPPCCRRPPVITPLPPSLRTDVVIIVTNQPITAMNQPIAVAVTNQPIVPAITTTTSSNYFHPLPVIRLTKLVDSFLLVISFIFMVAVDNTTTFLSIDGLPVNSYFCF